MAHAESQSRHVFKGGTDEACLICTGRLLMKAKLADKSFSELLSFVMHPIQLLVTGMALQRCK